MSAALGEHMLDAQQSAAQLLSCPQPSACLHPCGPVPSGPQFANQITSLLDRSEAGQVLATEHIEVGDRGRGRGKGCTRQGWSSGMREPGAAHRAPSGVELEEEAGLLVQ